MNRVAALAEEANHHPDIAISYKKVTLRWTTHSAGGITDRDRELAERTDALLAGRSAEDRRAAPPTRRS